MSAKEVKQVQDDKQALTAHFIQTLPPLLKKYLPDPEKIANLMVIPQYFDLEIYTTSRQEKNLETLLNLIQEIVDKHSETEVLEACALTLEVLCDDKFAIYSRCDIARSRLLDMVTNNYKESVDEYTNLLIGREEPNDDDKFSIKSSLKKVECFYSCHNLNQRGIWQSKSIKKNLKLKFTQS
jgi:cohesin complex subunit SA-1/2